ncbi:MAG: pilin [Pseudonocardiaceae bacterium]
MAIVPLAVVGLLVITSSARAETIHVVALAASVDQVLTNIRSWIMGILAGLATVFVSVGGMRYVMAGGDPGEVEKAKSAFRAAGIGYGMAALAPLVVTVLRGIVGA